jgi:hypothetical protein
MANVLGPITGVNNEQELLNKQQQPVAASPANRAGSGTYTNLQKYLKSNQGAGQQIAGRITTDVASKQEKVSGAMTEADKVAKAVKDQNEKIKNTAGIPGVINSVASGTGSVADLQAKTDDINYLTSGKYATDAEGNKVALQGAESTASGALQNVEDRAKQLGSESGRYNILSDVYKKPSYAAGQQRLDQLFLQQSGGNTLQNLQKSTAQTAAQNTQNLSNLTSSAYGDLGSIVKEGSSAAEATTKALTEGLGSLTKKELGEFAAGQAKQTAAVERIKVYLTNAPKDANGNPILTDIQLRDIGKTTGVNLGPGMNVYNLFDNPNEEGAVFPRPFGVFYAADRPCYEDMMALQIEEAIASKGPGDLDKLIRGKEVWEIK